MIAILPSRSRRAAARLPSDAQIATELEQVASGEWRVMTSERKIPVATGVASGPPTPGFFGSVDSGRLKVEIYGSVDYRRLQVAANERDTKCTEILVSVDFKGS